MKILKLSLKGLNSLADQVDIDFENDQVLSTNGLFAITGPTGSGKSTILDAVSLALYGQTPRLKSGTEIKSILTNGQKDGYSSLTFEANGMRYKADWSIYRSSRKPYNIQDPRSYLSRFTGGDWEIIAENSTDKKTLIPEIVGLNYDEFTRAILLAQGNFAGFLNASTKVRADILEKLTDTRHFKELSISIYKLTKDSEQRFQDKNKELELLNPLTQDEVKDLQEQLKSVQESEKELSQKIKDIEKDLELYQKISNQESAITEARGELEESKKAASEINDDRLRLKKSESLTTVREHISSLEQFQESMNENAEKKADLQASLLTLEESHKMQLAQKGLLETQRSERQSQLNSDTGLFNDKYQPLKIKIADFENTLKEKSSSLGNVEEHFKSAQKEKKKAESRASQLVQEQKQLNDYLNKWSKLEGFELHQLEELIQDHSKSLQDFDTTSKTYTDLCQNQDESQKKLKDLEEELRKDSEQLQTMKKGFATITKKLQSRLNINEQDQELTLSFLHKLDAHLTKVVDANKSHFDLSEKQKTAKAKAKEASQNLKEAEAAAENIKSQFTSQSNLLEERQKLENERKLQATLEEHRAKLKDGETCPLCGSREHSLDNLHSQESNDLDELRSQVQSLSDSLEKQNTAVQAAGVEHSNAVEKISSLADDIKECSDLLDGLSAASLLKSELYKAAFLHTDLSEFKTELEEASRQRNELDKLDLKLIQLDSRFQTARSSQKNSELQIKNAKDKRDELSEKLNTLKSKITSQLNRLDIQIPESFDQTLIKSANERVLEFSNKRKRSKEIVQEIQEHNSSLLKIQDEFTKAKAELDLLKTSIVTLKQEIEQSKTSIKEVFDGDLAAHLKELRNKLDEMDGDIKEIHTAITSCEANQKSTKKLIQNLDSTFKELEIKYGEALKDCLEKASGVDSKLKDLESVQRQLLPLTEEQKIRSMLIDVDKAVDTATTVLQERNKLLDELMKNKPDLNKEELQEHLIPLREEAGEKKDKLFTLRHQLESQREKEAAQGPLLNELEVRRKDYEIWSKINSKLGSADGAKFREIIQGLMFRNLIHFANLQLKDLSGRYRLVQNSKEAMDIDVIDSYLANSVRSTATLSGGETFLVSLALALSLSKMASKKITIKSLFMDEGFGTLDDETLAIALGALDSLQAKGSSIGVISHVKELKDAIPAQIQVSKKGGGLSSVRIVG